MRDMDVWFERNKSLSRESMKQLRCVWELLVVGSCMNKSKLKGKK